MSATVKVAAAELIIAGFGGQGVLLIGQLLAYAGMIEGKQVSWLPSYGPEMRGGTANCTVVISAEPVASPVVSRPTAVLALNQPSMDKFEPNLQPGGLLINNSSLVDRESERTDIRVLAVPATELAHEIGDVRVANVIMLGALLGSTGIVEEGSILKALRKVLPERRHNLIPLNEQALRRGMELGSGS